MSLFKTWRPRNKLQLRVLALKLAHLSHNGNNIRGTADLGGKETEVIYEMQGIGGSW